MLVGDSVSTCVLSIWQNQHKLREVSVGDILNLSHLDITEVCGACLYGPNTVKATYDPRA